MTRSLDLPTPDQVDTLAHELALLNSTAKRCIAILGSRHVPVTTVHLIELLASSLAQEGHNLLTSGALGTNAAVIRGVLSVNPSCLTVVLPQSLERQPRESRKQLDQVLHLIEKPEHDTLSLTKASSLCNEELISRCDQLLCFAFHNSGTLVRTVELAEARRKLVTLLYFD